MLGSEGRTGNRSSAMHSTRCMTALSEAALRAGSSSPQSGSRACRMARVLRGPRAVKAGSRACALSLSLNCTAGYRT